jgi:predicted CoA-substrate-specific enzyme activase
MQILSAGVDIGSTMTKVAIMDEGKLITSFIGPTGAEHRRLANQVMQQALEQAGLSFDQIAFVVATGYGRINVPFADKQITEITCHARGVYHLFPTTRTIIEIGGQDSKAIKLGPNGKVINFVMNDKCAAGTGRFLEVIAEAFDLDVEEMAQLSLKATKKEKVSSTCTVFAEQEMVSRMAGGAAIENVVAGLFESTAIRIAAMADRIKIEKDLVLTGGGAKNVGVVKAFTERLGFAPLVPTEPLLTGAMGAALLGRELAIKAVEKGEKLPPKDRVLEEATFFG